MGASEKRSAELDDLERRIRAARGAGKPQRRRIRGEFTAAHMAWRMTLELIVGGMVGGAIGWGLDVALGTRPAFLVVFLLLGMAAGIRTAMSSAEELRRRQIAEEEEERRAAEAAGKERRDQNRGT